MALVRQRVSRWDRPEPSSESLETPPAAGKLQAKNPGAGQYTTRKTPSFALRVLMRPPFNFYEIASYFIYHEVDDHALMARRYRAPLRKLPRKLRPKSGGASTPTGPIQWNDFLPELKLLILSHTDLVDILVHRYDKYIVLYLCPKYKLRLVRRKGLGDISAFFAVSRSMSALVGEVFFRKNLFQFDYDLFYDYEGLAQFSTADLKNLKYLHVGLWGLRRLRHVLDWVAFLHYLHRVTNPGALHLRLFFEEWCLEWDRDEERRYDRQSAETVEAKEEAQGLERLMTMESVKDYFCHEAWLPRFGKLEIAWPVVRHPLRAAHWETFLCRP